MCSMVGVKYYLRHCAPADITTKRLYKKDRDFIVDIPTLHDTLRTAGIAVPQDG